MGVYLTRMAADTQYYLRRSVCLHASFIEDWSINIIDPALTQTETCWTFNHIIVFSSSLTSTCSSNVWILFMNEL